MKMKVAIVQMDCELGNIAGNLAKTLRFAEELRGEASLIAFPELSLTGYSVKGEFYKYALHLESEEFAALKEASREVSLLIGFVEEGPAMKYYNSYIFVHKGKVANVQRKIYLPTYGIFDERKYFASGDTVTCFDLGHFRFAPMICNDIWQPSMPYIAASDDANVFIVPVSSARGGLGVGLSTRKLWNTMLTYYAMVYGSYVIFANRSGREEKLNFWGGSKLVNPLGQMVCEAKGDHEQAIIGEMDINLIRQMRIILPTHRDNDINHAIRQLTRVVKRRQARI